MMDRPSLSAMGDALGDILVVDDYPDTLALYEAVLADDGHRVRTARSGVEALRMVDEHAGQNRAALTSRCRGSTGWRSSSACARVAAEDRRS